MSELLSLKKPQERDWPRILEILRSVNFHRIGGPEMPSFPLQDCFVAEINGHIIGVAGYKILDHQTAKTTLMAVDGNFRRIGAGKALHQARVDYLRTQGIKYLYTNSDDQRVINWYQKHFGYRLTGGSVHKKEPFGLADKSEWTTLVCELEND